LHVLDLPVLKRPFKVVSDLKLSRIGVQCGDNRSDTSDSSPSRSLRWNEYKRRDGFRRVAERRALEDANDATVSTLRFRVSLLPSSPPHRPPPSTRSITRPNPKSYPVESRAWSSATRRMGLNRKKVLRHRLAIGETWVQSIIGAAPTYIYRSNRGRTETWIPFCLSIQHAREQSKIDKD